MELETTGSATSRSKFTTTMGWMRRTGMLYVVVAILMASCKSCNCSGCSFDFINQFICQVWKKVTGCNQICQMRLQLVDQNGNNLTNVNSGSFARIKIHNANNVNDVFFSGRANFDANGMSQVLQLNRCVDPCTFNFAGNPFGFALGGFDILTRGHGCPAGECRFWDLSSSGSNITPSHQGCVLVLKIKLTPGGCEPC